MALADTDRTADGVDYASDFLTAEELGRIEADPILTVRDVVEWRRGRGSE